MSNEKIRALMAKITIQYCVYQIGPKVIEKREEYTTADNSCHVLIPIEGAKFDGELFAEEWIRHHFNEFSNPLTIVKIYE